MTPNSNSVETFVQFTYPKFYHPMFTRSEVIVLSNKPTHRRRWKHPILFATLRRRVNMHDDVTSQAQQQSHGKQRLKRCVLRRLWKSGSDCADVTCCGRLFQTRATATGKARSPTVDNRVRRMTSDDNEEERSWHRASKSTSSRSSSSKYGATGVGQAIPHPLLDRRVTRTKCQKNVIYRPPVIVRF